MILHLQFVHQRGEQIDFFSFTLKAELLQTFLLVPKLLEFTTGCFIIFSKTVPYHNLLIYSDIVINTTGLITSFFQF